MLPRDLADYGGPKIDAFPVSNPEAQVAADEWNREAEDLAQSTRTVPRAIVLFNTTAVAAPVTYAASAVSHRSVWGTGDATKPTVSKTATGLYTVAYAASYNDGLGVAETVSFFAGKVSVRSTNAGDWIFGRLLTLSGSTATLMTYEDAGAWALTNTGAASGAVFEVMVELY